MDSCAESLKSVVDNYSVLQELWEESEKLTKDPEMATFDFYFGVYIGEMILRHSSRTLQKKIYLQLKVNMLPLFLQLLYKLCVLKALLQCSLFVEDYYRGINYEVINA